MADADPAVAHTERCLSGAIWLEDLRDLYDSCSPSVSFNIQSQFRKLPLHKFKKLVAADGPPEMKHGRQESGDLGATEQPVVDLPERDGTGL
ncbi:hypothetical protein PLEOSDRAFT_1088066 [Pleurotus ostreatus PC15]|uniref:Uncharacterized protein n=1 Tax=Pleurotus ostreatus (strain PC15) TaxID=1137138 RepID=A0A067PCT6_PLEO1|nr:hypothetical protein PLEOSDRAFT_1088066 [Pleurotus ostreatus PC15]